MRITFLGVVGWLLVEVVVVVVVVVVSSSWALSLMLVLVLVTVSFTSLEVRSSGRREVPFVPPLVLTSSDVFSRESDRSPDFSPEEVFPESVTEFVNIFRIISMVVALASIAPGIIGTA